MSSRFWARVDTSGSCWLWTGARKDNGYGVTTYAGRTQRAHRVAWMLTHGSLPCKALVCHRCDVRHCVNPAHLFLGTHQDNSDDMVAKGRSGKGPGLVGDGHPRRKLSSECVRQIRALRTLGVEGRWVAGVFGVAPSTVAAVVHGQNWRATQ